MSVLPGALRQTSRGLKPRAPNRKTESRVLVPTQAGWAGRAEWAFISGVDWAGEFPEESGERAGGSAADDTAVNAALVKMARR